MRAKWFVVLAVAAGSAYGCGTLLSTDSEDPASPPSLPSEAAAADGDADGSTTMDSATCAALGTCADAANDAGADADCDAQTACNPDQCGTVSNGCGGKIVCGPGCAGHSYCDVDAGKCVGCGLFETGCSNAQPTGGVSFCNVVKAGNRYTCDQAPTDPACEYCPNPTTGKGQLYCCP